MKVLLCCFWLLVATTGAYAQQNLPMALRVATYNLRLDTQSDGINAWPNRKGDVAELIRYHGFDIIGTQEGFLHQIQFLCEETGFAYFGGGRDDGIAAGEHAAILYNKQRFLVLDSGNFWLRENPNEPGLGWDATCCFRICSWVLMQEKASGQEFYVFNTHFDHQGVIARQESAKLLLERICNIAGNKPVICTGDFNSTPETSQIQQISSVLNDSYTHSEQAPYGPVGTFNGFKWDAAFENRIDYVFVSPHFQVKKYAALSDSKNQRYPSDHLPVVADLVLSPLTNL